MMSDHCGHTGLDSKEIKRHRSRYFDIVLSQLQLPNKGDVFIIHVSTIAHTMPPNFIEFLSWLHFEPFHAPCKFEPNHLCYWHQLAITKPGISHYTSAERFTWMVSGFTTFASKLDNLYSLREQFNGILHDIDEQCGPLPIFNDPVDISADPGELPSWVDEIKTAEMRDLETQHKALAADISKANTRLQLACATDDVLVKAVVSALHDLDLHAEQTEKSANLDVQAWTKTDDRKFGMEVTGLNQAIKKASKKLIQILEFEQNKSPEEKGIIIANTHNQTQVSQRPEENFTVDAIKFLSPHPILLMTGYDLYRLLEDVRTGKKTATDVVDLLYTTDGVFQYS